MADLEYHVQQEGIHVTTKIFDNFDKAREQAIYLLSDPTVRRVHIDVVTWTYDAAVQYGGDNAGDIYDEDPEASVHDRIECTLNDDGTLNLNHQGRIP